MENVWKKALSVIQSEVNEQVFENWFLPVKELSCESDVLLLGVPNKFFENWLREKYSGLIGNAVHHASGQELDVRFRVLEGSSGDAAGPAQAGPDKTPGNNEPLSKDDRYNKDNAVSWLRSVFTGPRQMPESMYRDIGLNPNYTFDNFVVGQSNRFAHAAALAVCEKLSKVYNPLFLYGGVGLGKTHLMQALGQEILSRHPKARVLYLSSEEFTNQLISAIRKKTTPQFRSMYRKNVDVLLVDDIQFIAGKDATQEEFFHTFNALYDAHKQIVICSDRPPQEIKDLEERLMSRFAWGLIADVQPPDFETRMAILEKKSENEELKVSKDVLFFLAENIKTNIRELEGALIRVVAYSKLSNTEMTVDLARNTLRGMISAEEKKITIGSIQKIVADYFSIPLAEMKTKKRSRSVVYPRQIAMYLSRELTDHSLPDIGGLFGGRDHTTVLHACDKINKELKEKEETRTVLGRLKSLIKK